MRPTSRQRLVAVGALVGYLLSLPLLGLLWAKVASRRFPQLQARDQLEYVGIVSTTFLSSMLLVAVVVVLASTIAIFVYPQAVRIPLIGVGVNVLLWVASVATMVEPVPILGG